MDTNDFYEEDETVDEVRDAWRRGDAGTTEGPRTLSPRDHLIASEAAESLQTMYVDASGWFGAPQGVHESQVSSSHAITVRDPELTRA